MSFTGSTHVGRIVNQAAAPTFKKVHLEMGGKNVIMIMDDADLELAVDGCLWGGFGTTGPALHGGQPRRRPREGVRQVRRAVRRRARSRSWSATASTRRRRWARRTARASCRRSMKYVEIGKDEGATLACGGNRLTAGRYAQGLLPRADDLHRRRSEDADRARRDLRTGGVGDAVPLAGRGDRRSATASSTGSRPRSTRRTSTARSPRCAISTPASSTSTRRRSAPKCTCRSAARRTPATATARRASRRSTSSRSGSPCYIDFSGKLQRAQIDVEQI